MAEANRTATEPPGSADRLNRGIAQDAQTDSELESIVPPVSRNGTIWRVVAVAVLLLALLTAILWMV